MKLMKKYVIFGYEETQLEWDDCGEPIFWNNNMGWGDLSSATVFTEEEWNEATLPINGTWVQLPEGFDE